MKNSFLVSSVKLALALCCLAMLGLPILELWKTLVLMAAWLALACSEPRLTRGRVVLWVGVTLSVVLAKELLPRAAIEEGHNIFLVTDQDSVLRNGIPPSIYDKWRPVFEKQYPAEKDPGAGWRTAGPVTVYASSSDALWRPAKYSRQVDTIGFQNLTEFRGGFTNDTRYNFFGGDALSLTRGFQADLPFFVMYEFSRASVGSTLFWQGTLFWERANGPFEEITHAHDGARQISTEDVGRKVYLLHLPAPITARPWEKMQPVGDAMHLQLRPGLAAARLLGQLLSVFGIVVTLVGMTRIQGRRYLAALALVALSLVIVGLIIHFSGGKYLGATYPPHGGGDDGLTHESVGRTMARELMAGDWKEALRGGQSVYWDTPGMRYVRFVEKIIFGDTNLGYLVLVGFLPLFVCLLIQQVAGVRWAVLGTAFFLLSPLGSLSFVQYIQNAKLGYAEAIGFGVFILGTYLLVRTQPKWAGERNVALAFVGGACLAAAMFVRPNLALAVALLGTWSVLASWRSGDFSTMTAVTAGLALALWMPLHNYLYGHQFVLISASASGPTAIMLPLSPATYLRALQELITGSFHGKHLVQATKQVSGWLFAQPRLPVQSLKTVAGAFLVFRLVTLTVTAFAALGYLRRGAPLSVLAWTALAAHLPMLFVLSSNGFRYAMIAWDLSAVVTLVVVANYLGPIRPGPSLRSR